LWRICREIVLVLPSNDELLSSIETILGDTGMTSGESGLVEAYKRKKKEINGWFEDSNEKVRLFAEMYTRSLDRQIAAEQRRSEERVELRKRMYEAPDDAHQ
jgi:hypothetical protein